MVSFTFVLDGSRAPRVKHARIETRGRRSGTRAVLVVSAKRSSPAPNNARRITAEWIRYVFVHFRRTHIEAPTRLTWATPARSPAARDITSYTQSPSTRRETLEPVGDTAACAPPIDTDTAAPGHIRLTYTTDGTPKRSRAAPVDGRAKAILNGRPETITQRPADHVGEAGSPATTWPRRPSWT